MFKFFDKNNDGVVSYAEFVSAIRGPISDAKAKCIQAIADKYFTSNEPVCLKGFIEKNFDFSAHPAVKAGKQTKEQKLAEMIGQFSHISVGGKITKADWIDMLHNKAT